MNVTLNNAFTLVIQKRFVAVQACFPLPWSVEELDACFVVRDASGQALSYIYFEDEPAGDLIRNSGRGVKLLSLSPSPAYTSACVSAAGRQDVARALSDVLPAKDER